MCGIAGMIKRTPGSFGADTARQVGQCILHRGPDSGDQWNDEHALLVHQRLKIIDLSDLAKQPMHSTDGRYVIIFNGEIYNYLDLKKILLAEGFQFRSHSDTEVLLNLYISRREKMLGVLNGIFSFAIWDKAEQKLFAARDHFGIKPFYYHFDNERFTWASEIKALFASGVDARLREDKLNEQLVFGYIAGQHTIYDKVYRLLPGHYIELAVADMRLHMRCYFDNAPSDTLSNLSESQAAELVYDKLHTAVKRQMVSDVPVGFMCSGGIDSSAITALSSKISSDINSYCIKIPSEGFDESYYGRLVGEYCHTHHHELLSSPEDTPMLLKTMVWLHDEPLRHPNSLPIFQVCRLAKERVTVLLSGEGSDEIFAGYSTYTMIGQIMQWNRTMPRGIMSLFTRLAQSAGKGAKALYCASAASPAEALMRINASYDPRLGRSLFPGMKADHSARMQIAEQSLTLAGGDPILSLLMMDQRIHLQSLLDRQDKMCMGASIEGRVPFLDIDLAQLANSLPSAHKVKGKNTKVVLRDALRNTLPEEIFNRPKYAFSLPIYNWMKKSPEFSDMLAGLQNGNLAKMGILDKQAYTGIWNKFKNGDQSKGDMIWNILNLEMAYQLFVSKELQPDLKQLPAYQA